MQPLKGQGHTPTEVRLQFPSELCCLLGVNLGKSPQRSYSQWFLQCEEGETTTHLSTHHTALQSACRCLGCVCVYNFNKGIREGPSEEVTSKQNLKMRVRHKHKGLRQEGTGV